MKKIIALALAMMMVIGVAACGKTEDKKEEAKAPETLGEFLLADFKADPSGSAQEVAERVLKNEKIVFMSGATPIEPGFLSGFDNTEIKDFKEGAMFGPMMGTIPFVGYIFILEDGADVDGFKTTLKDNANLRWNICTEAEELIVENEGNTVFFLMCPKALEE